MGSMGDEEEGQSSDQFQCRNTPSPAHSEGEHLRASSSQRFRLGEEATQTAHVKRRPNWQKWGEVIFGCSRFGQKSIL